MSTYSITIPTISIKKHKARGGEVVTSSYCELGGVTWDNLNYDSMVAIEKVLSEGGQRIMELSEAYAQEKKKRGDKPAGG